MTKSKSSVSSIVVPSIFVINLVNGAKFLNVTWAIAYPIIALYIEMTKSKSSVSSIVVPSIFVINLVNGAKFLNVTWVTAYPIIVISSLTQM